jgi:hypothetical protein
VVDHGINIKEYKKKHFGNWTETEIKLRICRLLKIYDLSKYEDRSFANAEEIMQEAVRNREEGLRNKSLVGGVYYNPPADMDVNGIFNSRFRGTKAAEK